MVGVVPNYANGTVPSYDAFEVFVKGNPSGGSGIQDFYTPPDWNAGSSAFALRVWSLAEGVWAGKGGGGWTRHLYRHRLAGWLAL